MLVSVVSKIDLLRLTQKMDGDL